MSQIYTAKELIELKPTNPTNWIVEDLLRTQRKRPSLLCGFPEAGKSTLALQLALAVANGDPFLGRRTTHGHVIYWKNEDSAQDVYEDFSRASLKADSKLSIILPEPSDLNWMSVSNALELRPDTKLVILETLADFLNIPDITNNDDCRNALQKFVNLIMVPYPDCAFLMLHHFNKSSMNAEISGMKILGATALSGGTDTKIYLHQVSDLDSRRVIHATVRKGSPIEPTYLDFNPDTLTATLGDTVKAELISKRTLDEFQKELDLDGKIQQFIQKFPGMPKWDVVRSVGGNSQRIGKHIDDLIQSGLVEVRPGVGRGSAQLLYLPGANSLLKDQQQAEVVQ